MKTRNLNWCPKCREKSVAIKMYSRNKEGKKNRVEYCINKGCGYKRELPFQNQEENKQ